jgi:hypothetical protein
MWTSGVRLAGMGGRMTFSSSEIDELRSLLRELRRADRDRQKSIRARMRRMGFYITDFSHDADGFTASDLNEMIARGITVTD